MKTIDKKLTIGLIFYPMDKSQIDLKRIYKKVEMSERWEVNYLLKNLEIQFSSHRDDIIIRADGRVFYYRNYEKEQISSGEIKFLWDESMGLIDELRMDVKYENEIDISIHAKNADKVYEINKSSIEEFCQNLLRNFSLSAISDKESALATITPVPEAIPFKVLG